MNNLGNWIAEQLITEQKIKTVIAIYPGRFQPMGPHHVKTYNWLAKKFGAANTFVVTSDKVKLPKSPLNFKEKESIINKHGINNVVQVRNPYQATELLKDYDPETTAAVFMVGEKDAQRLGGNFFRPWEGVANVGYRDGAYTLIAPHVSLKVMPFGEMSGTTLRQALADADPATFRNIMGFSDQKTRLMLIDKFKDLQKETIGNFLLKHPITEISLNTIGTNTDVDDGPRYFYGSQAAYEQSSKEMAEKIGYSVIDYIMNGGMSEIGDTTWPKGPPMGVSYFPVGDAGSSMSGTDYTGDIKGKPAYIKWRKYIQKVATQVGYKFLDFLGAEDSIESTKNQPSKVEPLVQENVGTKEWWSMILEDVNEDNLHEKIDTKKLFKKLTDNFRKFISGVRKEGRETKEAYELLLQSVYGNKKLSDEEKKQIGDQLKDILKLIGFTAASILPGGFIYLLLSRASKLKKHMIPSAFLESINEAIIKEAKANTHLTHLEELLLTQGQAGYKMAKGFLVELVKNLRGNSDAKVNTTVKWDGAPAIFVGINPDNRKFFVGTKSVFNKVPKINYTEEDIDMNHGEAPGLAVKLKKALKYLPSLGIKNILQGDFMFDDQSLKTQNIDGKQHYTFKPNAITYAVEADSDLGKKIARSKFGIVFHTAYSSLDSGAQFGVDVSGLNNSPTVWYDDAFFKDTTGNILLTNEETKLVLNNIKKADTLKIDYDNIPSALLNIYINSEIKANQFLDNPNKSFTNFVAWVQNRIDKKVAKLKTDKGKQKATDAGNQQIAAIENNKADILNLFIASKLLADAKMIFVNKYNNAIYRTKHFKDDGAGGLAVTAPEGYVAIDRIGNGVKLVDRLEFSRANFAMDKGFTK